MKSFAFAAALVAVCNAVDIESYSYGGFGGHGKVAHTVNKTTVKHSKPEIKQGASQAYGADYQKASASDWDAWGRDQDLSISESYGKTNAKSYAAESYDEWDNQDNDKWGAQAWGKDRDVYGASSYGKAASAANAGRYGYGGKGKGGLGGFGAHGKGAVGGQAAQSWKGASAQHGAAKGGYDNDVWAKQAYGSDFDSRWGKSYDSVDAKSYDGEWYARSVRADDDQWAEDYDKYDAGDADSYGKAASGAVWRNNGGHGWGKQAGGDAKAASAAGGAGYWGKSGSDWDAWGRDQDYKEDVSYDKVQAKAYSAESYDEWDNKDDDKWGAQAWGKDRDVYGASSYGAAASAQDWQGAGRASAGKGGHGGYGHPSKAASYGKVNRDWRGASNDTQAARGAYDNDEWAKQAYGSDFDSRWGKSYDSVSAKSYDNESYARAVQADDDQWAEDYDRYDARDANSRGAAASKWAKENPRHFGNAHGGFGKGGYGGYSHGVQKGGEWDGASKAAHAGYGGKSGSDWDAWGRDQDLSIKESYDRTWAKSYDAESYDEWDNKDDDKWGAQAWGKDRDQYGASSQDWNASQGDYNQAAKAVAPKKQHHGYGHGHHPHSGHGYGHGGHHGGYGKHHIVKQDKGKVAKGAH